MLQKHGVRRFVSYPQVGLPVVVRVGGKERRRRVAIGVDGDGGSKRKKQKLEEGRGREEDTAKEVVIFTHFILTTTIEEIRTQDAPRSPEVERITTEGNTSWLRGSSRIWHKCQFTVSSSLTHLLSSQMAATSGSRNVTRQGLEGRTLAVKRMGKTRWKKRRNLISLNKLLSEWVVRSICPKDAGGKWMGI